MKVAILVLFALIAVSQAAFTKSLVQQAQPVLSQAIFQMRMRTTRSNAALQNQVIEGLQTVVTDVLNQIDSAVGIYNTLVEAVTNNLNSLYDELISLGSGVMQSGSDIIQNFLQNIFGGLQKFDGKVAITGTAVLTVLATLGLDWIFGHLADYIAALLDKLGLGSLAQSALGFIIGDDNAQAIIDFFSTKMGKGFWDSITNGLGNAWDFITEGASNAWDWVSTSAVDAFNWVITNIPTIAFEHIQAFAIEFVQNTAMQAVAAALPSIMGLVDWLAPHAVALGDLYTQVMNIIGMFSKGIKLIK